MVVMVRKVMMVVLLVVVMVRTNICIVPTIC